MSKNPYTPNFHVMLSGEEGGKKIPEGMAVIWTTDNMWIGTSNGYPAGQPALYKKGLADAICQSVNLVVFLGRDKIIELWPSPGALSQEFWDYFGWDKPTEEELAR